MTTPKKWAQSAPEYVLECRDTGHAWQKLTASRRSGGGFIRKLACPTCGTVKEQQLNKDGYILKTRFFYDAEYLSPKGLGMHTKEGRALIRLTHLRRSI